MVKLANCVNLVGRELVDVRLGLVVAALDLHGRLARATTRLGVNELIPVVVAHVESDLCFDRHVLLVPHSDSPVRGESAHNKKTTPSVMTAWFSRAVQRAVG
jgi:hypothetical protein